MITPEKTPAALYAIHSLMVKARWLAGNGADQALLYRVLDWGEALPALIARRAEDTTEEFREALAGLAADCPECAGLLANFDRGVCWDRAPLPEARAS